MVCHDVQRSSIVLYTMSTLYLQTVRGQCDQLSQYIKCVTCLYNTTPSTLPTPQPQRVLSQPQPLPSSPQYNWNCFLSHTFHYTTKNFIRRRAIKKNKKNIMFSEETSTQNSFQQTRSKPGGCPTNTIDPPRPQFSMK